MEHFDYYVSGVKVGRQVPRFEAVLISENGQETFSVNQALNEGPFILIFGDINEVLDFKLEIPVYFVVRDEASKIESKGRSIIADTSLEIAESFGVLNEKSGLLIPSVFGIKASGQLGFKVEGIDLKNVSESLLNPLVKPLKS